MNSTRNLLMKLVMMKLVIVSMVLGLAGCSDDGSEEVDMVMEDMAGDDGAEGEVDFDATACPDRLVQSLESCEGFPEGAVCPGEIPCMCGGSMLTDCPCIDGSWSCGFDCGEGPCGDADMVDADTDVIDVPVDLPEDTDTVDMETDAPDSACSSDADCEMPGESCVGPDDPLCGICNNAQTCQNNNQCGNGEVCDDNRVDCLCVPTDTVCVTACEADMDCPEGETCQQDGTCEPTECQSLGECPANFVCANNVCQRTSCLEDADCDDFCVNGSCFSAPGYCSPPAP